MFAELIQILLDYAALTVAREEKLRRMMDGIGWFREEAVFFHQDAGVVLLELQGLHDEVCRAAARGGEVGELLQTVADEMMQRGWVSPPPDAL